MASVSRKYKEAQERWIQHCHDIERSTAKIPKGTEQERKDRIARARKDYRYFVRTYFPHLATTECADFQVDAAIYMRDHENARGLFEWARGHAKSTHISLLQPLWLKIQPNAQPLIMILVSKSQEAARRLLGDLQAELESNDLYNADFGNQRGAGIWTNGEFTTATGDLFIALGRGQSPRGIKKRGLRPNYIAVDDIDDDELVRNPRRVGEAVDWLMTALLGTMAMGRGRLAVVGNRIGRTSVIGTLADNPHFHHTVVNALDRKGLPSWPQNYTLREIAEMRGIMGERRFQREYMNNPVNAGTVFEEKHVRFGKMLRMREYRAIVCYTDPSFKASATADFKATMLVGITPQGKYHVLKAYTDWLRDGSVPQTQAVPEATQLSRLFGLRVTSAFVIALAVGLLVYYFLFYTSKGFQLRAVGLNMTAAEFNGFAVKKYILMSFIVSGAIAGLGGSAELLGTQFRLINGFGNGYGFDGVAMALIGQLHPLATIVVAIFFAALRVGSTTMQAATGVPTSVSDIIQALVIVFTVAGLAMVKLPGFKAFLGRLTERRKEAA